MQKQNAVILIVYFLKVVSTGATDTLPYLMNLGSDFVVDYTSPNSQMELEQFRGYARIYA